MLRRCPRAWYTPCIHDVNANQRPSTRTGIADREVVDLHAVGRGELAVLPAVVSLRATSVRILIYTLVLWACTVVFSPVADMGNLYLGAAIVLGGLFTWMSFQLTRNATPQKAMRLFGYSITYITLLFGAMAVDQLLRSGI